MAPGSPSPVRALYLGERLDLRTLDTAGALARSPLVLCVGSGHAVLFRYGTVVLFGVDADEERRFLARLQPLISAPFDRPELEEALLQARAGNREGVEEGVITLAALSVERMQVIADVLAKSSVLSYCETDVSQVFDRIEPLAQRLRKKGTSRREAKSLVQYIGGSLLTQHRTVGRVAVLEKPELLWEHPELERLYYRLSNEFELADRQAALEAKLTLIARTAETLLDLLQSKRSLRVEWYIVLLIVIEIMLTTYEMFIVG
ncbi:MAG: RMD1 family protein [Thiohalomonadaceae bacterium]